MSMKYKKELSYVCLGISITAMLLYFYLTIENYLNFSGIVMFSVLICSTPVSYTHLDVYKRQGYFFSS